MEALQIQTRMTRGDLTWYFVRHYFFDLWMPWLMAFGVAAVYAGFRWYYGGGWLDALTIFLGYGFGMLFGMFLLATVLYASRMRKLDDDGLVLEQKEVTFSDEGVAVEGSASSAAFGWDQVRWVKAKGRFLFLRLRDGELQLMYPLRDLPEGAVERVQSLHEAAA